MVSVLGVICSSKERLIAIWVEFETDFLGTPNPRARLRTDWTHQDGLPNHWTLAGDVRINGYGKRFSAADSKRSMTVFLTVF